MKRTIHLLYAVTMLALVVTTSLAQGQEPAPRPPLAAEPQTVVVITQSSAVQEGADASYVRPWGGIQHTTGPGIGYGDSFSTLEGFIPVFQGDAGILFADLRGVLSNNSLVSANLGGGYRYYSAESDRIWGANVFWDNRDTGQHSFNQVGFGFESLGSLWDARTNVYLVTGAEQRQTSAFLNNPTFFQYFIQLSNVSVGQGAMSGFDAEIGVPLSCAWGLKAYVGTYDYQVHQSQQAWGIKTRLEERVSDNLDLSLTYANDQVFGNSVIFEAGFRFGGGRAKTGSSRCNTYARRADRVERNHQIVVADQVTESKTLAIDPATGQPVRVVHVINNAPAGGDGTFEHPINQLAPAPGIGGPRAIILVYRGDGTSVNMDRGVALLDGQRLLGDSLHYTFVSQAGVLPLPNRLTGVPTITAGPGLNMNAAVLLANANGTEVAGLNIGDLSRGIIPDLGVFANGVNGFNIHDNNIQARTFGIIGEVISGNLAIVRNTITIPNNTEPILLQPEGNAQVTATVSNNTLTSGTSTVGMEVDTQDNVRATFTVTGNVITVGPGSDGLEFFSDNTSRIGLTVAGNSITTAGASQGILVQSFSSSQITAVVTGNSLRGDGNGTFGYRGTATDTSTTCLGLHGNTSTGNVTGYSLEQSGTALFQLERDPNGAFPPTNTNTGTLSTSGTITPVSFGSCQP